MWGRAQGQRPAVQSGQHEAVPNLLPPTHSYHPTSNRATGA